MWRWRGLAGHHRHRQSTGERAVMYPKKSSVKRQERLQAPPPHVPLDLGDREMYFHHLLGRGLKH